GRGPELPDRDQQAPAALERGAAGTGQRERAAPPVQEPHAELALQALQPARHGRLGQEQLAGGPAHRSALGHRHESADVIDLHFGNTNDSNYSFARWHPERPCSVRLAKEEPVAKESSGRSSAIRVERVAASRWVATDWSTVPFGSV